MSVHCPPCASLNAFRQPFCCCAGDGILSAFPETPPPKINGRSSTKNNKSNNSTDPKRDDNEALHERQSTVYTTNGEHPHCAEENVYLRSVGNEGVAADRLVVDNANGGCKVKVATQHGVTSGSDNLEMHKEDSRSPPKIDKRMISCDDGDGGNHDTNVVREHEGDSGDSGGNGGGYGERDHDGDGTEKLREGTDIVGESIGGGRGCYWDGGGDGDGGKGGDIGCRDGDGGDSGDRSEVQIQLQSHSPRGKSERTIRNVERNRNSAAISGGVGGGRRSGDESAMGREIPENFSHLQVFPRRAVVECLRNRLITQSAIASRTIILSPLVSVFCLVNLPEGIVDRSNCRMRGFPCRSLL